jgi:hypothetical protein
MAFPGQRQPIHTLTGPDLLPATPSPGTRATIQNIVIESYCLGRTVAVHDTVSIAPGWRYSPNVSVTRPLPS